jgi:Ser/Thr protein kinase RdoA (MazF antagonist)
VLDDIATRYDLGQWRTVQPLSGGFRIATEAGDFVVAVSAADRSEASLRFEAMLLNHLEDKAFLAPRLVRTRAGRPWHRSASGATALVTEWVAGGVVDASLAQHRRRSMRALAEYHLAVCSFPPRLRAQGGPTVYTLGREGPAALEAFTGTSGWHLDADGRRRLRSTASYLWRQFIRIPEQLHSGGGTLPRLVIHGGFGPTAVVLDTLRPGFPSDGLAGFDHCRYDLRARDLAGALETFAREAAGGYDLDRCADVMASYDEVDRLSPTEVSALPTILRTERLVQVFRLTAGPACGPVHEVVEAIDEQAAHLRWLEEHEVAFVEALASSCVG